MSGIARKMKRKKMKVEGTLTHKKVIAKKMGCSLAECNRRLERREKNLRKLGGKEDGKE